MIIRDLLIEKNAYIDYCGLTACSSLVQQEPIELVNVLLK